MLSIVGARLTLVAQMVGTVLLPVWLGACASEPWVKPYERERLAAPLMAGSGDVLLDRHRAHIHEVREGARGATAVQGGGCGCN